MYIRCELPQDIHAIEVLTKAAFALEIHSSHTEQFIVNALRRNKQLTVSMVSIEGDQIMGSCCHFTC